MNYNYNYILDFWYENELDYTKWFESGTKYDDFIIKNFKDIHTDASEGYLLDWLTEKDSYLAMIILLDQFSRHIYRGTNKAYENDEICLLFTQMGLDYLDEMKSNEKIFVLLPFQHSENLKDQKLGLKILKKLIKNEPDENEKNILRKLLFHQKKHLEVIQKFGRFPKRNNILGRENTEEEVDYIDENTEYDY